MGAQSTTLCPLSYYLESLQAGYYLGISGGAKSTICRIIKDHTIREHISTSNHIRELNLNPESHGGAATMTPY